MDKRYFDLNLLPIAVALYEERSVTRAAARLGLNQPSLSKALAKLRTALEDELFVQTSHGMEPTILAKSLVRSARQALSRVNIDLLSHASFEPATTRTTFRLALSEVGELLFLPKLIKSLQTLAPHASICPVLPQMDEISDGLESGKIDLAIGVFPELRKNAVFRQRLLSLDTVCLLRTAHPIRSDRLSLKEYLSLDHLTVRAGHSPSAIEQHFSRGHARRKIVLVLSHFLSLPEIIKQTDLVATINSMSAAYFCRKDSGLRIAKAPPQIPKIEMMQFWHRKFTNEPRNKWLRQMVKSAISGSVNTREVHFHGRS